MTGREMWNEFISIQNIEGADFEEWAFGAAPDELADLVKRGIKTATASAFQLYEIENESLPKDGYSVILNSNDEAVCVIQTEKVYVIPFNEVSEEHAYKEGEGDRSLEYWREVHKKFFTDCLAEAGLSFSEDMGVVCEEFKVVYK